MRLSAEIINQNRRYYQTDKLIALPSSEVMQATIKKMQLSEINCVEVLIALLDEIAAVELEKKILIENHDDWDDQIAYENKVKNEFESALDAGKLKLENYLVYFKVVLSGIIQGLESEITGIQRLNAAGGKEQVFKNLAKLCEGANNITLQSNVASLWMELYVWLNVTFAISTKGVVAFLSRFASKISPLPSKKDLGVIYTSTAENLQKQIKKLLEPVMNEVSETSEKKALFVSAEDIQVESSNKKEDPVIVTQPNISKPFAETPPVIETLDKVEVKADVSSSRSEHQAQAFFRPEAHHLISRYAQLEGRISAEEFEFTKNEEKELSVFKHRIESLFDTYKGAWFRPSGMPNINITLLGVTIVGRTHGEQVKESSSVNQGADAKTRYSLLLQLWSSVSMDEKSEVRKKSVIILDEMYESIMGILQTREQNLAPSFSKPNSP